MSLFSRHCLWILRNEKTLTSSESIWKELDLMQGIDIVSLRMLQDDVFSSNERVRST